MKQAKAIEYCKNISAHLPTKEEYEQLAKYLGKGTTGYFPYLDSTKTTPFLPNLLYPFWTSDPGRDFERGDFITGIGSDTYLPARCVK